MKTLKDVKDIPKKILSRKTISLYKAFILNNGDVMSINVDIDVLSLTEEDAIKHLLQSLPIETVEGLKNNGSVNIAILKFKKEELTEKSLVDEGDIYFEDGNISITLKEKLFDIDVKDVTIIDLEYDVDPATERKDIQVLKFENVK